MRSYLHHLHFRIMQNGIIPYIHLDHVGTGNLTLSTPVGGTWIIITMVKSKFWVLNPSLIKATNSIYWAVVVTQLVEWSYLSSEAHGSNPVVGKKNSVNCVQKTKIKQKAEKWSKLNTNILSYLKGSFWKKITKEKPDFIFCSKSSSPFWFWPPLQAASTATTLLTFWRHDTDATHSTLTASSVLTFRRTDRSFSIKRRRRSVTRRLQRLVKIKMNGWVDICGIKLRLPLWAMRTIPLYQC